jgi:hypothetical protein
MAVVAFGLTVTLLGTVTFEVSPLVRKTVTDTRSAEVMVTVPVVDCQTGTVAGFSVTDATWGRRMVSVPSRPVARLVPAEIVTGASGGLTNPATTLTVNVAVVAPGSTVKSNGTSTIARSALKVDRDPTRRCHLERDGSGSASPDPDGGWRER